MSLIQQLKLEEITEPAQISQWPAFGWWLAAGLIMLALLVAGYYGRRIFHQRQRFKKSLQAVDQSWQNHLQNPLGSHLQGEFNSVIKRHLAQAGITHALSLQGTEWREFLQQHIPARHHHDIDKFVAHLYRPGNNNGDQNQFWYQQVKGWLRSLPC